MKYPGLRLLRAVVKLPGPVLHSFTKVLSSSLRYVIHVVLVSTFVF